MLAMPAIQEITMPITKFMVIIDKFEMTCGSLARVAPKIMGVDNRNENRTAPSLVAPINNPVVIVTPERETPGITASVWDTPIHRLVPRVILFISTFLALFRSAQ